MIDDQKLYELLKDFDPAVGEMCIRDRKKITLTIPAKQSITM